MKGYIYVRIHESYDLYDACKIGITNNIPDRDSQYATGEIKRGKFEYVFEIENDNIKDIENNIQNKFSELQIYHDAGTEFYNKTIIKQIEPYLIHNKIKYRILTIQEIEELIRQKRVKNLKEFKPRDYQIHIIENAVLFFERNNKGVLDLICGVGKTLISLWIAQKLNTNTILIGVPNLLLLNQWKEKIIHLFKDIFPILIISGNKNIEQISDFVKQNRKKCIVITTYMSSYKMCNISFQFDLKILDEAHHLTTNNKEIAENKKSNIRILQIPSIKQLSLTATLKNLEGLDDNFISNDNAEYFGQVIEKVGLLWAIRKNIICDYQIQTIITEEEKLDSILQKFNITDKRLFFSAYASLKSICDGYSHHLLIYANNIDNCKMIIQYIDILLKHNYFQMNDFYYSNYDGEMEQNIQSQIIQNFKNSNKGIITCVYCLGEGWDFPLLDGVVFAENMISTIRIVQAALRASRKNINEPDKITKIILPILNSDDWLEDNDNTDFKKVKEVIYQMGLEDETISQKIKVFNLKIYIEPKNDLDTKSEIETDKIYDDEELVEKIKLKTVQRNAIIISYEKAKKLLYNKNIKSKKEYNDLCEKDIRFLKNPELGYKKEFTNWIDYLSIERKYYDLETCKLKIKSYLSNYPDLKKYYLNLYLLIPELTKLDELFPPSDLWIDYYNVKDLREIIIIENRKKRVGLKKLKSI